MSFRRFICASLLPLFFMVLLIKPACAKTFVYISCADDGEIKTMEMNLTTGELSMVGKTKAGKVVMPMAVSPDRRYLYAAIRSIPYKYSTFAIDSNNGELTSLSTVPSPDNMVYISTDRTGTFLLGASYAGHKISVNPISNKGFVQGEPTQVLGTGRHAHSIITDSSNRFAFVPLLGADEILQFVYDEKRGFLSPNKPASVKTKANFGPRHIVFSPNNQFVYVVNELTGMINGYSFDSRNGLLKEIVSISAVPPDSKLLPGKVAAPLGGPQSKSSPAPVDVTREIQAADIHITPDGKFLYVSERTSSTIAAFAVDNITGQLRHIQSYETEKQPRGFNIDPRGNFLLAVGQKSASCMVYKINRETGELQPLKQYHVGNM